MPNQSCIWDYFCVCPVDNTKAVCNSCHKEVSRGGKTAKKISPTNLKTHLQRTHIKLYDEYTEKIKQEVEDRKRRVEAGTSSTSNAKRVYRSQQTIHDCLEKSKKWSNDNPTKLQCDRLVGEMIALDLQPFSITTDVGFQRFVAKLEPRYTLPSSAHLSRTIIPGIYDKMRERVGILVDTADNISFTTDIWSSVGSHSLMSLTGHWITEDFTRVQTVLNAHSFPGSHTGDAISKQINDMLRDWNIEKSKVHLFVSDNAANAKSGLAKAKVGAAWCFAHTLQLVVGDAIFSQRAVSDMLSVSRCIVGHFKHSTLAVSQLREIQRTNNLPETNLLQDVPTRWNSKLYMLQRLLEQKRAIVLYVSDHPSVTPLSANQWTLAEKLVTILAPFEAATRECSRKDESIGMVIPRVLMLERKVAKLETTVQGMGTTLQEIKTSMATRFANLESSSNTVLATIFDPRFKDAFFRKECTKGKIEEWITAASDDHATGELVDEEMRTGDLDDGDNNESDDEYAAILNERGNAAAAPNPNTVIQEYALYRDTEQRAAKNSDPLDWWKVNATKYPKLAKLARKYLSAPPTSVPSERLFSEAEAIYDARRSRLNPDKVEMLLFIRGNLPLLEFNYE